MRWYYPPVTLTDLRRTACSMIFDSNRLSVLIILLSPLAFCKLTDGLCSPGVAASATAWTVLVYDTIVLLLTIFRTYSALRFKTVAGTMRTLLKEGVAYYR